MTGADVVFFVASAVAAVSTLLTVTRRNPVYSAVWMMPALFAVAVIFLLLHSTFLFVVQVLLYAGAILVLFVFVIMFLNPGPTDEPDRPPAGVRALAAIAAAALLVTLARAIYTSEVAAVPAFTAVGAPAPRPDFGTTNWFGGSIYVQFLAAFEMISLLIVAAIAAVVVLAKRRLEEPAAEAPAPASMRAAPHAPRAKAGVP